MPLSHRAYFCKYGLNVEQYGEILIAQLFKGEKLGDAQRGYDVAVMQEDFKEVLRTLGINEPTFLLGSSTPTVRLEVKSKLSETGNSKATVIHCKDTKFDGRGSQGKTFDPMTHLAVVIVKPKEGFIENAWLMTRDVAASLRAVNTKTQYIPVSNVRKAAATLNASVVDVASYLREVADKPLGIS